MYFVYIIKSINFSKQIYTGHTFDLKKRLKDHNEGTNNHTKKFKPWELVWFCGFPNKNRAEEFERYLKSSSGSAFRNKRLI